MQTLGVTNRTGVSHGSPISRLQPNVCNPAGTASAPFFTGAPALFIYPTPGGRGSPPLRCVGKISASHPRCPQPLSHAASRRDSSPFRGAERAGCGAPASSFISRREGVEALPYGVWGRYPRLTRVARNPSVTPLRGATAPLSGEPRGGRSFSPLRIQFRARGLRAFACRGGRAVVQYAQGA